MLGSHLHPRLKSLFSVVAGALDRSGISPDGLTFLGFVVGVLTLSFLALGRYNAALVAVLFNRLLDGLDGALARRCGLTDTEGLLDVALDFLFYILVPFGFTLVNPLNNVLVGTWLSFVFIGTGSSFLAFAVLAARYRVANPGYAYKSLYYPGGLTEGTKTILLLILCCLSPAHFAWLAWLFGALCWLTTATRICSGYQTLKRVV